MTQRKVINFLGARFYAATFSVITTVLAVFFLATKGLNLGLDFAGGTLVEATYAQAASLAEIRETLAQGGFERATVVNLGSERDIMVRLPTTADARIGNHIVELLQKDAKGEVKLRRVEFVGPQVGEELREKGGLALLLSLVAVMLYVAFRFEYKFGVGAIISLFHDAIIALGAFALFQWEFDLTTLAAVLAIVGYSINDTIVVFDRIRENFRKLRKMEVIEIMNISTTETLDRTLATSGITLAVLLSLLLFGGDALRGFALALSIGTIVGTFSSIYVAAAIALWMGVKREDLLVQVVQKEGIEDGRP
ncbi:MAG: protein translocase subunit SecF [Spongiibacteraceae bacterium]